MSINHRLIINDIRVHFARAEIDDGLVSWTLLNFRLFLGWCGPSLVPVAYAWRNNGHGLGWKVGFVVFGRKTAKFKRVDVLEKICCLRVQFSHHG